MLSAGHRQAAHSEDKLLRSTHNFFLGQCSPVQRRSQLPIKQAQACQWCSQLPSQLHHLHAYRYSSDSAALQLSNTFGAEAYCTTDNSSVLSDMHCCMRSGYHPQAELQWMQRYATEDLHTSASTAVWLEDATRFSQSNVLLLNIPVQAQHRHKVHLLCEKWCCLVRNAVYTTDQRQMSVHRETGAILQQLSTQFA